MRTNLREDPTRYGIFASAVVMAILLLSVEFAWLTSRNEIRAARTVAAPAVQVASELLPRTSDPEPAPLDTTTIAPAPTAETATTIGAPASTPRAPVANAPAATVKPKAKAAVVKGIGRKDTSAYAGYGTWVDVFDWTMRYTNGNPKLSPASVDVMADQGVQTIYIQTARADWDGGGDIVEPALLNQWLARAKARKLTIVPWYLPTNVNNDADLRRLVASARLPGVTTIGVDIESKAVTDHDERSRRMVDLSVRLRAALPDMPLSAITLPNVVTDVMNTNYWPRFPWLELAPLYDVWQPMSYWTNRKSDSPYRNAELYTRENIDRMRAALNLPDAVVSPAGGIGDKTTVADIEGFRRAIASTRSIGGSLYDWSTQKPDSYAAMRPLRT